MNLLIVNNREFNPHIGGIEKVSNSLAAKLLELDYKVYFIAGSHATYNDNYEPTAPQMFLPDGQNATMRNKTALKTIIIKKDINIILNQAGFHADFSSLLLTVAQECQIPVISVIHTDPQYIVKALFDLSVSRILPVSYLKIAGKLIAFPYRYLKRSLYLKIIYKYLVTNSSAIVVLSQSYKNFLLKCTGKNNSDKIFVIPNFTEAECTSNLEKEKLLLFVGRLENETKRPDRLVQIWESLYNDFPDWELHILGDGPARKDLEYYVQKRKIGRIFFKGFIDPVPEYKKASILCTTSTCEGFPMVLIEAMAYGCIPIAFDSYPAVHDIIINDVNGYLIPKYKKDKYAQKLYSLMNNSDKRELVRKTVLKNANRFNTDIIIEDWIKLFKHVQQA